MTALSDHPKIISLARSLGLEDGDSVEAIKRFCIDRVKALVGSEPAAKTIDDVERIVCEKLNITIAEVWNETDIDRLIEAYAKKRKDPVFGRLRQELPDDTFATLFVRKNLLGETGIHYVAVIDCRGDKALRRFFTRWHEIAHVLTMVDQLELPFHRSVVKDPLERMMDIIAGEVGFLDTIFAPLVASQFPDGRLRLAGISKIRNSFNETASYQATLTSCAKHMITPVIILEAELGFNKAELDQRRSPKPGRQEPVAKLRVTSSRGNEAARRLGMLIPERMRVPNNSVILRVFRDHGPAEGLGANENLNAWSSSNGRTLPARTVWVEAKRTQSGIIAAISLIA